MDETEETALDGREPSSPVSEFELVTFGSGGLLVNLDLNDGSVVLDLLGRDVRDHGEWARTGSG